MGSNLDAEVWQSLGAQDPDWAVESKPDRKHGGWEDDLDAFYETGRVRVEEVLSLVPETSHERVLDWGSGTGRLSFSLASAFDEVTCVDISASMQSLLRERANSRDIKNLELVALKDFRPKSDHDLVVSLITLQHLPDRRAVDHALGDMVAALKPGGYMVVEVPASAHTLRYRVQPRLRVYRALRRFGASPATLHSRGLSGIKMLCISRDKMVRMLTDAGATVVHTREYRGTSHQFVWYVAQKPETQPDSLARNRRN